MSTSNCSHVNPPVYAVVKCEIVDLDIMDAKLIWLLLFGVFVVHATYSKFHFAAVCRVWNDYAWRHLDTTNVDSNHPN